MGEDGIEGGDSRAFYVVLTPQPLGGLSERAHQEVAQILLGRVMLGGSFAGGLCEGTWSRILRCLFRTPSRYQPLAETLTHQQGLYVPFVPLRCIQH